MKQVFLSLGSNLGAPEENLQKALAALPAAGMEVRRVSSLYRTEPVDFHRQPWFINCVAEVSTNLMPLQLLKAVQRVERELGRRRVIDKGPRNIDIDILLYDNVVVQSRALNIPHERLSERRFVLEPLCELAPDLRHPVTRRTALEMLTDTADHSQVIRLEAKAGAVPQAAPGRASG